MTPTVLKLINDFRQLDLSDIREAAEFFEKSPLSTVYWVTMFVAKAIEIHDKKTLKNEVAKRRRNKE